MACSVPSKMGMVSKSLEKTFWGGQENFYFVGEILLWGEANISRGGSDSFLGKKKKKCKITFPGTNT